MNTNKIIIKCQKGDKHAFSLLFEEFSDKVFSVAFRILNCENDAADIVQLTFISVWENIQLIDPEKEFNNWIMRITINKCYDFLRKSNNKYQRITNVLLTQQIVSKEDNPEKQLSNKEIGELISKMAEGLSPKQKIVFVLSELEGYSHDEVAEMTQMNKDSIKSNLNLARRKIGEQIEKYI